MSIPIRNIYYLLCYAWDRFDFKDLVELSDDNVDRVENLLGEVLRVGVSALLRAGLDRGYQAHPEDGRQLRGKIRVSETLQRLLLQQGRVAYEQDELTFDVARNRAIKAAMRALIRVDTLDNQLRDSLGALVRRMADVADCDLKPAIFRQIQLHRNVARYGLLLDVCRMVCGSLIPDPIDGSSRFHSFTASDQEMGLIFQSFVFNFLHREQVTFDVTAPKVRWDVDYSADCSEWLPAMQTDIALGDDSRRFIIETKYTSAPFHQWDGGQKKLRSDHLYQLMSYVSHSAATTGIRPVGILLYAGEGVGERLNLKIGGFTILVRSLDLGLDWMEINRNLIALCAECNAMN